ncbi:hypothetical protein [Enterovirga sp. CN4-39]|uniref:hypothetical protein n=1 Tax=Enterovirga sp. CN4-39 TaxID=3400910 RepID=UPI003C00AFF5
MNALSPQHAEALERFYRSEVYTDLKRQMDASFSTDPHQDRLVYAPVRAHLSQCIEAAKSVYLHGEGRYAIGLHKGDGSNAPILSAPRFDIRREALEWIAEFGSLSVNLVVVDTHPATEITGAAA